MRRFTLLSALTVALVSTVSSRPALAKKDPDLACRAALGPAGKAAVNAGLALVDKCQKKTPGASCNAVDQSRVAKPLAKLAKKCAKATCTQGLYGGDIPGTIAAAIKAAIESDSSKIFPAPSTAGDKAKAKCLKAIIAGRSALLKKSLASAVSTELRSGTTCGPLTIGSITPIQSLGDSVSSKIGKACGALQGADLGVCDSLPGCVIDAANLAFGQLGRAIYTAPPTCGDGVTEGTEQCDDGNQVDGDACTNQCQNAVCGDGITQVGVEECDDHNNVDTDACLPTCVAAKCGDGHVEAGVEQCDDGNADDGDACKNDCTLNRVACGPNGLDVTIDVANGPSNLGGVTFDVHFDHAKVSIPGQGTDGLDRTTVLVPDPEQDDFIVVNDEIFNLDTNTAEDPDRVRVVFVKDNGSPQGHGLANGPIVTFRYDCTGTPTFLPADFTCSVGNASTTSGSAVSGVTCAASSVVPAP